MRSRHLLVLIAVSATWLAPTYAAASCGDRPGTPVDVVTGAGTNTINWSWRNTAPEAGIYWDFEVTDQNGTPMPGGGAGVRADSDSYGIYANPGDTRCLRIKARTEAGTQGCVSQLWSGRVCATIKAATGNAANEHNTDRPGLDYKNFDLDTTNPGDCYYFCLTEGPVCKAWTYVRPGVQGPKARCWVKKGVPRPVANNCCESGVMKDR